MKQSVAHFAVHAVADRVGIAVDAKIIEDSGGNFIELTPEDVHPNEGFAIQFRPGWRSVAVVLVPGAYSRQLLHGMGNADDSARRMFSTFAMAAQSRKSKLLMRVNGSEVNIVDTESWPAGWSKLELQLKRAPIDVDTQDDAQMENLILELVIPMFCMVVALVGAEENDPVTPGEVEGRSIQTISTRYERNRLNREACIQLKGTRCAVCEFDFAAAYGALGIGYIEIHHLKPVSVLGADYRVDVLTDLAPLCSNCHAMAHREEPPVSLERLRELVLARSPASAKANP